MRLYFVVLFSVLLSWSAAAQGVSDTLAYVLGPQDQVMIRVNSLRRNTGEIYTWQPLSGDFSVGADGAIFIPVIGLMAAAGKTPDALATGISEALKSVANLTEMPFTTVEVTTYRPVFIIGAVQRPGKYEFQPGMTVLQAIGTAEGFARSVDMVAAERDAIVLRGNVRELEAENIALEARLVRLTAESTEFSSDLVFPPEFVARGIDDPNVETAIRQETDRYEAGRSALSKELEAIAESKKLLQQELASLQQKSAGLDSQQALNEEEVKVSADLLERGLAVSSRRIAAENSRLSVQNNLLDTHLAGLRAQQSILGADRDTIDLRARYRKDALDNLVATRDQLERNKHSLKTAQTLLTAAIARSLEVVNTVDPTAFTPDYRIVRSTAAGREEMEVSDDFALSAGDVLQVGVHSIDAKNGP